MNDPLHRLMDHPSYLRHRKQLWTQILLPILVTVLVFIAVIILISLATLRGTGDVSRWAAISTMWLILPVLIAGLILLLLLTAMIYLLARLTVLIPRYSSQAQWIAYRIEAYVKHYALMFRKPVLGLQELARLVSVTIEKLRNSKSA